MDVAKAVLRHPVVAGLASCALAGVIAYHWRTRRRRNLVFAAVEGGGTTFRVALAVGDPTNIVERITIETTTPAETLSAVRAWLAVRKFDALGVATFGPVDCQPSSPTYGFITTTPKPGWHMTDVLSAIKTRDVPTFFDTDVNAPALAEFMLGNTPKNATSCAYITVGTGIGVGLVVNGKTVHGMLHPEGGHIMAGRMPNDLGLDGLPFLGTCPYHGDCIEGLTATGALEARSGVSRHNLAELPDDHPLWEASAHALASLCTTLVLIVSPERIILSGGVMNRESLYPRVRELTKAMLNKYVQRPEVDGGLDKYIVPSTWGGNGGIIGALTLAKAAYKAG